DPGTYGRALHGNREIPGSPEAVARDASGSPRTYADEARTREVGQAHSTGEVPEQNRATGGGGDGGKGPDQGELVAAKHGPDSVPEQTCPMRGRSTCGAGGGQPSYTLLPEVGAGNSSCPDLCGGCGAIRIPSATP